MSGKQPVTHTIDLLRRIERTIITSGRDGCTIEDLRAATGTTRRTIDRLLDALQTLGSGVKLEYAGGPVAGTWTHTGAIVFAHEIKKRGGK